MHNNHKKLLGSAMELIFFLCASISIICIACVLIILCSKTWDFFNHVSFSQFFGDTVWTPLFSSKRFGIWPLVSGSLLISFISMSTAFPLGILAAIYLSEFARPTFRKIVKPLLEILAGIPTVVYGYFALSIVTPLLGQIINNLSSFNALSAGLVLGIMLIPTICSLCEDALFKTPKDLKEASYALGASKLSTIFLVIVPYAKSSIIAAFFLALSRSLGESVIVSIAAGLKPNLSLNITESMQTMTAYIVQVSMGDTPQNSLEYLTIFAVAFFLFLITFILNLASRRAKK